MGSPKGLAVVSTEAALRLEFVETPSLHPTVVPVLVQPPAGWRTAARYGRAVAPKVAPEVLAAGP